MGSSQNLLRRRVVDIGYMSIRGVRSDRGFMAIARAMSGRRAATAIAIPIFARFRSDFRVLHIHEAMKMGRYKPLEARSLRPSSSVRWPIQS